MKLDSLTYKPTRNKWDKWDIESDGIDYDYKEWKTQKLWAPYKTIDYDKIFEPIKYNNDFKGTYTKIKQWMDDYRPIYAPYIPTDPPYPNNPSNPNANINPCGEVPLNTNPFTEYPPTNAEWHEYHDGEFSTLIPLPTSITQAQKALELIEKTHQSGTKVFIARSRSVRDSSGHMNDPWNRSMTTYRTNFQAKLLSRQQTKVEANSCDELLTWEIETTLKGTKVLLIVWETVKMSYVRRKTIDNFLARLDPVVIKLDTLYEV